MSPFAIRAENWLGHSLAAAGLLLLLASLLMLAVREPARRHRIGAWSIRATLLLPLLALGPSWLRFSLPAEVVPEVQPAPLPFVQPAAPRLERPPEAPQFVFVVPTPEHPVRAHNVPAAMPEPMPARKPESVSPRAATQVGAADVLFALYLAIASILFGRWLLAHWVLRRIVRLAHDPEPRIAHLFAGHAARMRTHARLLVVERLRVPVCGGLWRPTVFLPAGLAATADDQVLRWVFAHELAHLRRGDPWTCLWSSLTQVLFFPLPWFWWIKRQIGLTQEYLADAAAAGLAARVEDYADFLVALSRSVARSPRLAAATGVLGNSSDLSRRITMLLKNGRRLEGKCPRHWSLLSGGGFLALAILLAGVGCGREALAASARDDNKDEPKKESVDKKDAPKAEPKKEEPKKAEPKKPDGVDPLGPNLRPIPFPGGVGDPQEMQQAMQKAMAEMMKRMQQRMPGVMIAPGLPGMPGGLFPRQGDGRLGAMVEKPSDVLVEQLDLPKGQGLVIEEVKADSAAAKAGLKANDILLELAGKPVSSDVQEFRKQLDDVKANSPIEAVVLRKGKKETVKGVSLPEAKAEPERGFPDFQNIPGAPIIPAPPRLPNGAPIQLNVGVPGFAGKGMTMQITNGNFTLTQQDDGLSVTVTGKMADGKPTLSSVSIRDGNDKVDVDSLDAVPEKYRAEVNKLLKSLEKTK